MSHFKPYPKYKPSGVEWLGDVPEHWEVKRLKFLTSCNNDVLPETMPDDYEMQYVDIGNVEQGSVRFQKPMTFGKAPSRARRKVRDGDVIISTVRTYLRAMSVVHNPPDNLIVSTGFAVIRASKIDRHFLAFALESDAFIEWVVAESKGISYPAINASELMSLSIAVPSKDEQSAIAAFLDRETGRIDALVEKKRRFVELLKEKRQALITAAVTGKFDVRTCLRRGSGRQAGKPYPAYKPSGVEWLGDVPEHWEVRRLKDVGMLIAGSGFPHEFQNLQGEELFFYKVGDLSLSENGRHLLASPHTISRKTAQKLKAKIIPPDSIVYAKVGAALLLNRRRITTANCCIDNNMTAYIVDKKHISPSWAFQWLSTLDFGKHVNPGAVPSFGEGYQAVLPIFIPSIDEQSAIADFLDHETGRIDALVEKTEKSIELLREKRAALITAVVTGKVDVREAVKQ